MLIKCKIRYRHEKYRYFKGACYRRFILSTGVAGEILQKFVNYGRDIFFATSKEEQ
ncbi:MAG: DUF4180 domain-containing protein [Oscillospiraceae bacterium]